jgi:hypothetical protein
MDTTAIYSELIELAIADHSTGTGNYSVETFP